MFDLQFFAKATISTVIGAAIGLTIALLLNGCSHTFNLERARQLGCNEACERAAVDRGLNANIAYVDGESSCACEFDDGSSALTCRRPMLGGGCP